MLRLSEEHKANPWAHTFLLHPGVCVNIGAHFHTKSSGMQRQKVREEGGKTKSPRVGQINK